jgi:hypothetical protein
MNNETKKTKFQTLVDEKKKLPSNIRSAIKFFAERSKSAQMYRARIDMMLEDYNLDTETKDIINEILTESSISGMYKFNIIRIEEAIVAFNQNKLDNIT